MPINAYTGLMGSGKSYEVVLMVILPAIQAGRRVVTNVDGINEDAIHAYLIDKKGAKADQLGKVVHVTNEQCTLENFFPYGTEAETIVQPGDMVCIDEAWRFWGTDSKIPSQHFIFFREHRHYVHPDTKVSCDLVLMVQDITDLHRRLKVVVELTFRTEKKKSLGLNKTYSVSMYEGYKVNAKSRVQVWVRNYDKEVFPLYSSYVGGKGKELQVDKRQNIFRNPRLWMMMAAGLIGGGYSMYNAYQFFQPKMHPTAKPGTAAAGTAPAAPGASPQPARAAAPAVPQFSEIWRLVGTFSANGKNWVIVANQAGALRVESPSVFRNEGLATVGDIDGAKVTVFSGAAPKGLMGAAAPAALGEVKK